MLNTERNTPTMAARVLRAFKKFSPKRSALPDERKHIFAPGRCRYTEVRRRFQSDFEHGQWWITDMDTGEQWSVCDAEGSEANGVFDGFCFEQVTKGEKEAK